VDRDSLRILCGESCSANGERHDNSVFSSLNLETHHDSCEGSLMQSHGKCCFWRYRGGIKQPCRSLWLHSFLHEGQPAIVLNRSRKRALYSVSDDDLPCSSGDDHFWRSHSSTRCAAREPVKPETRIAQRVSGVPDGPQSASAG
jgi:hypothetical protein